MLTPVSVKTLAEFVHRRGDLYPSLGRRVTGEEGIATQKRVQRGRGDGYERERSVAGRFERGGLEISLSGRVDGCDLSLTPPLLEEIKTTRAEAADAERAQGSAHWAQARLYAALLAAELPTHERWLIRLLYCHPDTDAQVRFDEERTAKWLADYLDATLENFAGWLAIQQDYARSRDEWLSTRAFPYGEFRAHQRALSGRVFQAFRDREHLLLEAPTGSGKTMGVLFPALKALSSGMVQRLFYLTSRGTGALAVLQAAADCQTEREQIRVVEIVAKEKACLVEGMPCDERCAYSVGYYDRIRGALTETLAAGCMDRGALRAAAEAHEVCPFELSLDAALWADLIVGDYNYLLDPVVRLQRFMEDDGLGLLIDESHQLAERTRDMLSLHLDRRAVKAALAEPLPAGLSRRLKGVDRALMGIRRSLVASVAEAEAVVDARVGGGSPETVIEPPTSLQRAAQKALDALVEDEIDLSTYPLARQVLFDLSRLLRARNWTEDEEGALASEYRYLAQIDPPTRESGDGRHPGARSGNNSRNVSRNRSGKKSVRVSLVCLNPARYLDGVLAEYGPHVRFSGTVTPLGLYQKLHGQAEAPAERVESPFSSDQLATLIVRDLPVYYRQREETLPRLAELVRSVVAAQPGNYLVALPSFHYLGRLQTLLEQKTDMELYAQTPGMSEAERASFLERFQADGRTRLGLIVLGGVFAESVDFSHGPLAGVICVGVGLPPASTQKEEMRAHYDGLLGPGEGNTVAYQQPAMTKVMQMAGRLLRGPEDRGVLCLVDDRFAREDYQRFFPRHWRPLVVRAAEIGTQLDSFWQADA